MFVVETRLKWECRWEKVGRHHRKLKDALSTMGSLDRVYADMGWEHRVVHCTYAGINPTEEKHTRAEQEGTT